MAAYKYEVLPYDTKSMLQYRQNKIYRGLIMEISVIGYPRIGALRELKFAIEKYFNNIISKEELQTIALKLKKQIGKPNGTAGSILYLQTIFPFTIIYWTLLSY